MLTLLLSVVVALAAALVVACRLFCKTRRERDIAKRKLSEAYQANAHLVGVIRVLGQSR